MDVPAPSVVSLNGTLALLAINERALHASGARPVDPLTALDFLGIGRPLPAQWIVPQRVERNTGCVTCSQAGTGDAASLSRYAI